MRKGKWIILLVIVALTTAVYTYLRVRKSDDFEPKIKAKLAKLVSDASNGLYKLDMDHIEIDITSSSVIAKNIMLMPDSARMLELENAKQLGNDVYTIFVKKIDLDGLSPLVLLDKKNIDLNKLVIDSPEIKIVHSKRTIEKKDSLSFYDRVAKNNQSYSIGSILLNNIKLTIVNLEKNKSISSFKNLSASFTDIKIDSSTKNDSSRFLFAKDAVIVMKNFSQITPKHRYHFDIDSVALRPQEGTMQFFDLRLKPEGSKEDFSKQLKQQQDRYDINLKKGSIKNINWFSLLSEDGFYGDEIISDGGFVHIYHDRSLPDDPPKQNNFPHQMLMNIDFPVSIKKAVFNNVSLSYQELNPVSDHTGTVEFNNIHGEIINITNVPSEIIGNHVAIMNASADFMNEGKLSAVFKFDLAKEKAGNFSVDATLGAMQGQSLNKMSEGLGLVKIKTLAIDKLVAHITGTHTGATGTVQFAYHDLSFEILKKDDEGDLKKRGLMTFIANKFITNKANPQKEGKPIKQVVAAHQHNPSNSFFNLVWKTILDGILKTVK